MTDKTLINIIYLTFGAMFIGLIALATNQKEIFYLFDIGSAFFILTGGYLIVKNGSFIKTFYFKLMGIGVSLILIGVMLKIMHWPLASLILVVGYGVIILLYFIYQLKRPNRKWIDWLKLVCLMLLLTSKYFKTMHWPYHNEMSIVTILLLAVIVIEYIRRKIKSDGAI